MHVSSNSIKHLVNGKPGTFEQQSDEDYAKEKSKLNSLTYRQEKKREQDCWTQKHADFCTIRDRQNTVHLVLKTHILNLQDLHSKCVQQHTVTRCNFDTPLHS
eukprot:m.16727 g.16727  ORF g.16727 m.16727 type:complete len:103 (+) comp9109_c0_seq1:522-830(+)